MSARVEGSDGASGTGNGFPPETAGSGVASDSQEIPRVVLPTRDEMMAQEMMNNCGVKTVLSGVMGGGMGVLMGALFGALDQPLNVEEMTARQQLVHGIKQMGSRSWHMAKTFAVMGALFSGTECIVEKARAKHDSINAVAAGCITGGIISARAGPQAACIGCAGFAAFSLAIDKFMERYE